MLMTAEPSALYSSRSFWYPQAPVSDYATARIRISVPPAVDCVASGELEAGFPAILAAKDPAQNRKIYLFMGDQGRRGWLQNLPNGPFLAGGPDDQFGGPMPDNAHFTGVVMRLNAFGDGTGRAACSRIFCSCRTASAGTLTMP